MAQDDGNQGAQQQPEQRGITIHTQYVKDLSFENPNAPQVYVNMKESPSAQVAIDVQGIRLQENTYEVVLNAEIKATVQDQTAFVIELKYGGLVTLSGEISDEQRETVLLIEVPRYLFPFARNVISDATREGGFPPLLINPVDFTRLYRDQKARQTDATQQQANGNGQQA
ncbi:protein-export chaperone SecB [Rhodovibrio salinarum]|uniref:Protein-export protein SecB n=1 Tax=Rhodovibrio salinarum TaxID=1087 RepID=A0A934QHH8_9PROT|nr:protein-export chaperone SecB [Rhodovibrio salinarum]MBK1696877.1 protein-export chaperone SecB [Rhodovibrio salinarum]